VITRLSEHRGKADRDELADLIEDVWRDAAPAHIVEEWDAG
jgi:hypothetical protein